MEKTIKLGEKRMYWEKRMTKYGDGLIPQKKPEAQSLQQLSRAAEDRMQ